MDLLTFKEILDTENFTTSFFEKSKELPFDRLNAIMPTDLSDKLLVEMIFPPGTDDFIKDFRLFQYFVRLPIGFAEGQMDELKRYILKLNMGLPLMGFGLNEEDQYIYFKSITLVPDKDKPDHDVIRTLVENIYLIGFIFTRFYEDIKKLAAGKVRAEKLMKKLA